MTLWMCQMFYLLHLGMGWGAQESKNLEPGGGEQSEINSLLRSLKGQNVN